MNGIEIKQEGEKEAKTKKHYHLIMKNTIEIRRKIEIEMVTHIITKFFRVLHDNSVNIT